MFLRLFSFCFLFLMVALSCDGALPVHQERQEATSVPRFLSTGFECPEAVEAQRLHAVAPVTFKGLEAIQWGAAHVFMMVGAGTVGRSGLRTVTSSPEYLNQGPLYEEIRALFQRLAPQQEIPAGAGLVDFFYAIIIEQFQKGPLDEREASIFDHLPDASRTRGLSALGQTKTHWIRFHTLEELGRRMMPYRDLLADGPEETFWEESYSAQARDGLWKRIAGTTPEVLPYLTEADFSLAGITYAFMHHVAPLGLGADTPHGGLKEGAFVDHDYFHKQAYQHGLRFQGFVSRQVDRAIEAGVDGHGFLDRAGDLLQQRFRSVGSIGKHLFWCMAGAQGRAQKIANVGLFFLEHEAPTRTQEMYEMQHPWDAWLARTGIAQKALQGFYAHQDEALGLRTDPVTGVSPLSDAEIFEHFLPSLAGQMDKKLYTRFFKTDEGGDKSFDSKEVKTYLTKHMTSAKIKRSKWRTDMWVYFDSGKELYVGEPSNALSLSLNDDYRQLLGLAGFKVKKPAFEGGKAQENLEKLGRYNKEMHRTIEEFFEAFNAWSKAALIGGFSRQYTVQAQDQLVDHTVTWIGYGDTVHTVTVPSDIHSLIDDLVEEKGEDDFLSRIMFTDKAPVRPVDWDF